MDVAAKVSHVWSKETKSVEPSILCTPDSGKERGHAKHVGFKFYHKEHDKDWKNMLFSTHRFFDIWRS